MGSTKPMSEKKNKKLLLFFVKLVKLKFFFDFIQLVIINSDDAYL